MKFSDETLRSSLDQMFSGNSMRSVARGLNVDSTALKRALVKFDRLSYYQSLRAKRGALAIVDEHISKLKGDHKKQAKLWLDDHRDKILSFERDTPELPDLMTSQQEHNRTVRETRCPYFERIGLRKLI